jgi:GAF domain-containing protein
VQSVTGVMTQGDEIGHLARVLSKMVLSLQARMADLRTIYDVGRSISASIELEDTLKFVADSIRGVIPYDAAEISLLDTDENHMVPQFAVGGAPISAEPPTYPTYRGLIGRVVTIGEGVLVPDLATAPEAREEPARTWQQLQPRAYLGVPLNVQGKTIGVIELVSRQAKGFTEDNLRLLASIAMQAAIALQNARAVRTRENQYKQQIQELHIEIDEMKRSQQVGEIVESEYFQRLSSQAQRLRSGRSKGAPSS